MERLRFNDLSFAVPSEWRNETVVTLAGRDSKQFAPNVVVTREAGVEEPVADYAKRQVPDIKRATKKHELVSEREETIAGQRAYVLEHRFMTQERVRVRQLQYFVRGPDGVIVMSLTVAEQEVKGRANLLRRMAASLTVEH